MSLITFPNSGNTYYFTRIITTNLIEHFGQLREFRIFLKCICFNFVTNVIKKMETIKSFWKWRKNFIRTNPFISAYIAFVKGVIFGGLIIYWYFVGF